jgi:transposase-like protein
VTSKFSLDLKARAIDLYPASEDRTLADLARELGIGTEAFRKWVPLRCTGRGQAELANVDQEGPIWPPQ